MVDTKSTKGNGPSTIDMATMPLTSRHYRIVAVASLGQLIGTALATMVSVMIPMLQIVTHPELPSWEQGLLGAIDLIGIAIGSVILGKLADKYGYLLFFRICPAIMLLAAMLAIIFPIVPVLFVSLFVIGFAIGGEYSLDSAYVSELMPVKWRSTMVGVTKTASAFGNILVAGACWWLLLRWGNALDWPRLMWLMVIISGVMILSRIRFYGSPSWLVAHGRLRQAEKAVQEFLGQDVSLNTSAIQASQEADKKAKANNHESLWTFIRRNGRRIIVSGVPWACEGLGVYGIGVFLPILLLALGIGHESPDATKMMDVTYSVELTFWISCVMLPGFILGLWLIPRMWSIRILTWGFFLSAASLGLLWLGYSFKWPVAVTVVAFMLFEIFLNAGPHLITYVLPPAVYPVNDRSLGSGIAACLGKVGAVLAVFFIPVILKAGGIHMVLLVSLIVMILGGVIARVFGNLVPRPQENKKTK